jgi:hypothetical protein
MRIKEATTMCNKLVSAIAALLLSLAVGEARAQAPGGPGADETYVSPVIEQTTTDGPSLLPAGTATYSRTISAWEFQPINSSVTWDTTTPAGEPIQRYRTGGTSTGFRAGLDLPSGAKIMSYVIDGCDSSATAAVSLSLYICPFSGEGSCTLFGGPSTGVAATPGCSTVEVTPGTQPVVNLGTYSYFVSVGLGASDSTTSFASVRLLYTLPISNAPATASFVDASTSHWAFQGIEALKASGITTGCNPPTYDRFCPEDPVTRAQMAMFLARALGLHHAP